MICVMIRHFLVTFICVMSKRAMKPLWRCCFSVIGVLFWWLEAWSKGHWSQHHCLARFQVFLCAASASCDIWYKHGSSPNLFSVVRRSVVCSKCSFEHKWPQQLVQLRVFSPCCYDDFCFLYLSFFFRLSQKWGPAWQKKRSIFSCISLF